MQDDPIDQQLTNLPEPTQTLLKVVHNALSEIKAQHIVKLPIMDISNVADCMVLVSGTSSTHVKAIANVLIEKSKANGIKPLGVEGVTVGEWVLVDLGDVIVHIMLPATREFYDLEKLWTARPSKHASDSASPPSQSDK